MTIQSGRSVVRLPQLTLRYLGNHRTALSSSRVERVPALHHVSQSQHYSDLVLNYRLKTPIFRRSYAQKAVSRPKAHTGRTTTAARKAPTTSHTKAAKKPAPKKTTPKAVPKAKSKAKPRIKAKPKPAKKKRAKAKPKPKPKVKKPKKVLTEAQKTALTKKKLKSAVLKPPPTKAGSRWRTFVVEKIKSELSPTEKNDMKRIFKEASAEYKQLAPEQVEHYNELANQDAAAKATAYRQWIESYTPTEIYSANLARAHLTRLGTRMSPLQDHRQVKRQLNAYVWFYRQRMHSGAFKGLKLPEATRLIGREWKGISASEKKPFEDLATQDLARYTQEMKTVMNRDILHKKTKA